MESQGVTKDELNLLLSNSSTEPLKDHNKQENTQETGFLPRANRARKMKKPSLFNKLFK